MTNRSPAAPLARALIRSLTRGTAIPQGVRYIHVGHDEWLGAQDELLTEIAEDGHSETKFVRGAYGAGKSHFLSVVQDRARQQGWMTSHIECKVDKVQIDRFETLYPRITAKLLSTDILEEIGAASDQAAVDPMRSLLERWTKLQLRAAGIREGTITRPFDIDDRLYRQLQRGLLQTNLPPDFTRVLAAYARASVADDFETVNGMVAWLRGTNERLSLPAAYLRRPSPSSTRDDSRVEVRPIGKGTVHEVMRGLLWLIRASGYAGLVLCIDEVEELAKLGSRKRQDQALQALREYVDHAGGEGGYYNLCMYLAATPDMFEGEQYFPHYEALATRIQPVGDQLSWRSPVIDLDRTPLGKKQMREVAQRIAAIHHAAYGERGAVHVTPEEIDELVTALFQSKIRIAKPRLLARVLVDALDRARQGNNIPKLLAHPSAAIAKAASDIEKEAAE